MLAKQFRIPRSEFMNHLRGRRVAGSVLVVVYSPNPPLKVAVIVSKKVAKRAVDRNHLRRRAYGVVERWLKEVTYQGSLVVQYKPGALRVSRTALEAELRALLAQLSESR